MVKYSGVHFEVRRRIVLQCKCCMPGKSCPRSVRGTIYKEKGKEIYKNTSHTCSTIVSVIQAITRVF